MVAVTHLASSISDLSQAFVWTCRGCIYTEAFLAISLLICLLLADPGIVLRTPQTCCPIPPEVQEALLQGEQVQANVVDEQRTFCVRCFVWRYPEMPTAGFLNPLLYKLSGLHRKPHHCSICQRCVAHFDHHCGVFGRCIGGGNIGFFYGLILMWFLGILTSVVTVVLAFFLSVDEIRERPEIVVPVCVVLLLYCCKRRLWALLRILLRCCGSRLCEPRQRDAAPEAPSA